MKVEIKKTNQKGFGVYAIESLKSGEIVVNTHIIKYLNNNDSHAVQIAENTFVYFDQLRLTVNHSCSPNCGIQVNSSSGHDLIAMKDIEAGEEITYDYSMENFKIEFFPTQCACQSEACRGRVTGWKDLDEAIQKKYEGFTAPYLLQIRA